MFHWEKEFTMNHMTTNKNDSSSEQIKLLIAFSPSDSAA